MQPGWVVLGVVFGGLLALWSVLIGAYFLVMALLERSDADDECEAPLELLERIQAERRHPSSHRA